MRLEPLLQPVGPLPSAVYWRRRAAVVAVVVGVLLLVALLARGLGGADRVAVAPGAAPAGPGLPGAPSPVAPEAGEAAPQPSATAGAGAGARGQAEAARAEGEGRAEGAGSSAEPSSAPERSPAPARSSEPQGSRPPTSASTAAPGPPGASAAPADPQPCRAEDLAVDVAVSPSSVAAGERVTLRVRVSAVAPPCRLDVGPVARAAEVRAGGAPVWSTEHCEAGDDSAPLVLRPGSPHEFTVRWEGRRTAPGCPGGLGGPSAGEHVAVVQVGPARSREVPFRLT